MSSQSRKFRKAAQKINEKLIGEIIENVVGDILKGTHPDNTSMHNLSTIGELRGIGAFYKVDWIVHEMLNAAVGRTMRMLALNCGIDASKPNLQIFETLKKISPKADLWVPSIRKRLIERFGDKEYDGEKVGKLYAKNQQWITDETQNLLERVSKK